MDYELATIGDGWSGTDGTVDRIYQLVDDSLRDPVVVRAARAIVRDVPERDQAAESRAISAYVRRNVRYTRESVESLSTPRLMIDDIQQYGKATGDCDEFTTLSMALHKAIGIPVRAVVISQRSDRAGSHIFAQALIKGRGWVTMDDIVKNKPYGWAAPAASRSKTKEYGVSGLGSFGDPGDSFYSSEEVSGMRGMNVSRNGPTCKMRSDTMAPPRRRMIGRSVASRGYRLKPTGMIYVDRRGGMSGVGVNPELGIDFSSIINTAIDVGGKAYSAVKTSKPQAKPPAAAPAAPTQGRNDQSGTSISPLLILLGVGAAFMFMRRK